MKRAVLVKAKNGHITPKVVNSLPALITAAKTRVSSLGDSDVSFITRVQELVSKAQSHMRVPRWVPQALLELDAVMAYIEHGITNASSSSHAKSSINRNKKGKPYLTHNPALVVPSPYPSCYPESHFDRNSDIAQSGMLIPGAGGSSASGLNGTAYSPSMGPSSPSVGSSSSSSSSSSASQTPIAATVSNQFILDNPSLFDWTRPDFFMAHTPPGLGTAAAAASTKHAGGEGDGQVHLYVDDSAPRTSHVTVISGATSSSSSSSGSGNSGNGMGGSGSGGVDNNAPSSPQLLPTALCIIEAHLSDPDFFFPFAGLFFSHVRRTTQVALKKPATSLGPAASTVGCQWGLVPGYYPLVHRFVQLLLLHYNTHVLHPDVLFCQDLILSNTGSATASTTAQGGRNRAVGTGGCYWLVSYFVPPLLLSASVCLKEDVERAFTLLSHWISKLGRDNAATSTNDVLTYLKRDSLTAPLPPNFPHRLISQAILMCLKFDQFQIVLKALTTLYRLLGHLYGAARVDVIEHVVLAKPIFLKLFLHWCGEIRRVFMYILLYRVTRAPATSDAYNLDKHAASAMVWLERNTTSSSSSGSSSSTALVPTGSPNNDPANYSEWFAGERGRSGSASRPNSFFSRLTSLLFMTGDESSEGASSASTDRKGRKAKQQNDPTVDTCVVAHAVLTPAEISIDLMFHAQLKKMVDDLRTQLDYGWSIPTSAAIKPSTPVIVTTPSSAKNTPPSSFTPSSTSPSTILSSTSSTPASSVSTGMTVVPISRRPYLSAAVQEFMEHQVVYNKLQTHPFTPHPPLREAGPAATSSTSSTSTSSSSAGNRSSIDGNSSSMSLNHVAVGHALLRLPMLHFSIDSKQSNVPG